MKLVTNKFKLANNLFTIFFLSNVDLLLVSYLNVNVADHATFSTQFNSVQMNQWKLFAVFSMVWIVWINLSWSWNINFYVWLISFLIYFTVLANCIFISIQVKFKTRFTFLSLITWFGKEQNTNKWMLQSSVKLKTHLIWIILIFFLKPFLYHCRKLDSFLMQPKYISVTFFSPMSCW